jgi:hypothetical protein
MKVVRSGAESTWTGIKNQSVAPHPVIGDEFRGIVPFLDEIVGRGTGGDGYIEIRDST